MGRIFALTILSLLVFSQLAFSQEIKSGIYLAQDKGAPICLQKLKMMNSKTIFCLPYEPFIGADDFTGVSEIIFDSLYAQRYIIVTLSLKASENLNTIVAKRPDLKLALVVDGKLINLLDASARRKIHRFNIYEALYSNELSWIHEVLKNSIIEHRQNN